MKIGSMVMARRLLQGRTARVTRGITNGPMRDGLSGKDGYRLSGETEPEDWEELLDEVVGEPELIEHMRGFPPCAHAYRMPNGAVYLDAIPASD
jgi:hypothetical protein